MRSQWADHQRAFLVKGAVVAEAAEEQLQRLALHQLGIGHIIDDDMRKIRLAGDRADGGEFRADEAREVFNALMRVRHGLQHRLFRRYGQCDLAA